MTAPRQPEYVHQTLASLFASDPLVQQIPQIDVMLDSADASHLRPDPHLENLKIHKLTRAEAETTSGWGPHRRFCYNYHRCLTLDIGHARGLLICEDDVIFREGFLAKLLAAIDEMEGCQLRKYLLACYSAYRLNDVPAFRRGRYFCSYYAPSFYGTQCMYYPKPVLGELADRLYQEGVVAHQAPGDMIVKSYGMELNAIYATVCSLAQHVGTVSTGLGNFHESPSFGDPFPGMQPAES
jgi:hypothetical protein